MAEKFDPYHRWLAIPSHEQPPNHYRLLGLAKFEGDVDVIDSAADRQMAHVRTHQSGKYADASQKLLNEIAAARVVLLDADKREAYDAQLRAHDKPLKQAASLAKAQPLEAEASSSKIGAARPQVATAVHVVAQPKIPSTPSPAKKLDATNLAPLLIAAGAGVLVLLLAVGVGAWLFFGGSDEQVVVVDSPIFVPDVDPQPVDPVIPPVHPVVDPVVDPAPDDPPVVDPVDPDPPVVDPIEPDPIDLEPVEDPQVSEPPPSPIAALFPPAAADERTAIPDEETRTEKAKQVEGLFSVSAARTPAQRAEMAEKLLATARDTTGDAAAQFVLLEMARTVASAGGHVDLAMEAIDELDEAHQVDGLVLRADTFAQASPAVTQTAARKELVDAGIKLVDELFAADKFVEAGKLIKSLQVVAAKTRDKEQRAILAARQGQGSELYNGFKDAQAAIETLKEAPDDADAALVAGKYYAFVKGDWQRGLVMLSVSKDEALKKLAEQEMAVPRTPELRKALADAWVDQSAKSQGLEADRQKARAIMWYGTMQSSLVGLAKVELQRKLEALGKIDLHGGKPFVPTAAAVAAAELPVGVSPDSIDLLALIDPSRDFMQGQWRLADGVIAPPERFQGESIVRIPYVPPDEYIVDAMIFGKEAGFDFFIGLPGGEHHVVVGLEADQGTTNLIWHAQSSQRKGQFLRVDRPNRLRYVVRKTGVQVLVNGETVIDWQGDPQRIPPSPFGRWKGECVPYLRGYQKQWSIRMLRLTAITGEGRLLRGDGGTPSSEAPALAASTTFTAGVKADALDSMPWIDGPFINTTAQGKSTLKASARFLYFKIDDDFLHDLPEEGGAVEAVATVFDGAAGWINIQYDAHSDVWKLSELKHLSGSGKWVDVPFALPEARLANRENGGADFRITTSSDGLLLHKVVLRRSAPAGGAIDLLKLVDTKKHSVLGDWRMVDGELLTPRQPDSMRLQIPCDVPDEYDLDLEVTRIGAGNELAVGMIYQGKQCSVGIDRYSARSTDILAEVSGGRPEVVEAKIAQVLKAGERAKVKCAVRSDSITVYVNDAEIVAYRGDARWSGMSAGWAVPDKRALMLGAWWAEFRIHSFTLTPVGSETGGVGDEPAEVVGGGSLPKMQIAPLPPRPVVTGIQGGTTYLIQHVDPRTCTAAGKIERNEERLDKLTLTGAPFTSVLVPVAPPDDYIFQFKATRLAGDGPLVLNLPLRGKPCTVMLDAPGKRKGLWPAGASAKRDDMVVSESPYFPPDETVEFSCDMRTGFLHIHRNGQPYMKLADWPKWSGVMESYPPPKPEGFAMMCRDATFAIESMFYVPWGHADDLRGELGTTARKLNPMDSDIDLIKHIDLEKDKVRGDWSIREGTLVSPNDFFQLLRIPCKPPKHYRLNLDVTRVAGDGEFVINTPLPGGANANLVIDAGDIKKSPASSWSINSNNESPKFSGVVLAQGRRTKLSVVIGDNSYQVQVDGRRLMGIEGALTGTGGGSDRTPPIPTFLAVGATQTEFHIHSLTLTPLAEGGRLINVPDDEAN